MKRILLGLLLLTAPTAVQALSITQNLDPTTILDSGSASCNVDGVHVDNSYLRRFFLNLDHGISGSYEVSSVDFLNTTRHGFQVDRFQ